MIHDRKALALYHGQPLEDKIRLSLERIQEWLEVNPKSYISFSGGKDSTVLLDLVHQVDPSIPVVYCDTGLEYQGVRDFALERANVVLRPSMRFDEVIKTYGYPVVSKEIAKKVSEARRGSVVAAAKLRGEWMNGDTLSTFNCGKWGFLLDAPFRVSHKCCGVTKERPFLQYERETGRKPILGMLAAESATRATGWVKAGCNAFDSDRPKSNPLSVWTTNDVLHYLVRYRLPYASDYGCIVNEDNQVISAVWSEAFPGQKLHCSGCNRTGCMYCLFGVHLERSPNRFETMRYTDPRRYEYCIGGGEWDNEGMWVPNKTGLGLGRVMDYLRVPY